MKNYFSSHFTKLATYVRKHQVPEQKPAMAVYNMGTYGKFRCHWERQYWVRSRFCHKLCRPASQHRCERSIVQLPCFEANLMLNPKIRTRATSFASEGLWRIKS